MKHVPLLLVGSQEGMAPHYIHTMMETSTTMSLLDDVVMHEST